MGPRSIQNRRVTGSRSRAAAGSVGHRDAELAGARDPDLVAQEVAGEAAALAVLYNRHVGVVFSVARRMLDATASAEDVLQDVLFRVWRRAGSYHPERAIFRTWC